MCVSVCTRVCALEDPLPPSTGGSVRPSVESARLRPKAARPRAHAERGDSLGPQHYLPRRAGRLRWDCGSAPPAHAPQGPQRKFGSWGSPRPIPVRVAATGKREPSGSTLDGAAFSQHPASRLPELLERRGKSSGRGLSGRPVPFRGRKERGAHLGVAHTGGSGLRARVRARGGCQRGWGCPELGLRAMPSGQAARRECGAASPGRRRHRCLQCRLAED